MAEISNLYSHAPNSHSQATLAKSFSVVGSTGIIKGWGNELAVTQSTPAGMSIDVDTGSAWIEGYYYENTAKATWVIDALADPLLNRIDRVCIESDPLTDLESKVVIVKGAEAAVPVAPVLTQVTGGIWQISKAQVYVATGAGSIINAAITDETDTPVICGYAQGLQVGKAVSISNLTLPKLNGSWTGFAQNHGSNFGVTSDGTNVYVIGGSTTPYNCVSKYSAGAWATKAVKTTAGYYFTATYYNGNIYCIGGINGAGDTALTATDIYNIAGNSWSAGVVKPTASYKHAQVYHYDATLGHQIYCFGGLKTAGGITYITTLDIYSITGNSWTSGSVLLSLPTFGDVVGVSNGTDIYVLYQDAGGIKFYKYAVIADAYTVLTAPAVLLTNFFYQDDYIYGFYSNTMYRYKISTDTWTQVCAATGTTLFSNNRQVCQFTDKRFVSPQSGGTTSWYYTYYYYIGVAGAKSQYSFRIRSDTNLKLFNITNQYASESIGVYDTDLYGIYCNLATVTTVGILIEIMG